MIAAFVPHPPLLVPTLAPGDVPELAELRRACRQAVSWLVDGDPALIVCVGPGERTVVHGHTARGSLGGFGAAVAGPDGPGAVDPTAAAVALAAMATADGPQAPPLPPPLPPSLSLARWLLTQAGRSDGFVLQEVDTGASPADAAELGRHWATRQPAVAGPVAWLVLGDGTHCRTPRAPGYFDPRAEAFDQKIRDAVAAPDIEALADVDPGLSAELGVAGRTAWQVLASAWGRRPTTAQVDYAAAPFGVGYLVARWESPDDGELQ